MKFDLLKLFAIYGREEKISLNNPKIESGFVGRARVGLKEYLNNEALLHGLRIEAMFEALVVSLGNVKILKTEDAGEGCTSEDIEIPDFRIVLNDGSQVLVEVKNFYQSGKLDETFKLKKKYFEDLMYYAKIMCCKLKIAIYWARWNIWTLVVPSNFQNEGEYMILPTKEALSTNEMSILGDICVGTRFPLKMKLIADKTKPRMIDDENHAKFTISDVELYCGGRLITNSLERDIATFIIFYGKWSCEEPTALITEESVDAVEYLWRPENNQGLEFESIGSLSSMFSSFYNQATLDQGEITQLHIDISADFLGLLIPDDYIGDALPLWRFELVGKQPS